VAVEDSELVEQFHLASVIEKLVETFNASNDKPLEDPTKRQIQSSVFNNKLNSAALQQPGNKIIQSLNGGEPGLYALILRSEEIETKADGSPSTWWSILMEGAIKAADVAEEVDTQVKSGTKKLLDFLAGSLWDSTEKEDEKLDPVKALDLLNFKGYYIFILTNVSDDNPIPVVLPPTDTEPSYTYQNLASYPIAQAISKRLRTEKENFEPGTLVKIQYENSINKDAPIVVEIIEDRPEFTAVIMASMAARSALNQFVVCDTDSSLSGVKHPSGDTIGTAGSDAKLHNGYAALNKKAGKNIVDVAALYKVLFAALPDKSLVLGILANAYHESNFDANIISGVLTESSIGLWQGNVQAAGSIDVPDPARLSLGKELPSSIRIPAKAAVVPYYAGGLLLTIAKIPVITPAKYDGTQDLTDSYNKARDPTLQTAFVIVSVKKMLKSIEYDAKTSKITEEEWKKERSEITARQWAAWFQVYFEQPKVIKDRTAGVNASAEAAGVKV